MTHPANRLVSAKTLVVDDASSIEDDLQGIWKDVKSGVAGIIGIGIVSKIGFPISVSFSTSEIDDAKCAALVAAVITVADSIGSLFESMGSFKQSIFTSSSGFLLFYEVDTDIVLFCVAKTESTRLGLINFLVTQKMSQIRLLLQG